MNPIKAASLFVLSAFAGYGLLSAAAWVWL